VCFGAHPQKIDKWSKLFEGMQVMRNSRLVSPSIRLIDIQEASKITGVSIPTLYKWVSQRKIPHIKMGRLVKFDPLKLDEWIKQQTVMPMPERKG